ncbi:hypothetical protein WA026_012560 [Henosepilachna vigintioctopunctata]|uniref:Uncharacterized protein n=1 Tax=Henosepilachna vigintioctopunctata TaxID=420089 RepID=A0AAW1U6M7_9CUCU
MTNQALLENSVVGDMKTYVKSLEEEIINYKENINMNEKYKIEIEEKLEQKNSQIKNLLEKNDQLRKYIEETDLKNNNLQKGFEKLKEKKQNLEAVIVTLQQQLKSVNGELQTCKNLHTDDEIETREPSSNFRIAKQGEVVTTDQRDKMLENLQISFEKRLDTKIQKLVENFDNKITNLKAQPDYQSNPLLFREDIKKEIKTFIKQKLTLLREI